MLITPDLHAANRIEKQLISVARRRRSHAGLQLPLAHGGKRIRHDRRRTRAHSGDGAETQARLAGIRASDDRFPRTHGKIPPRARLSDTARLAGRLFLQHEQTARRTAQLVCASVTTSAGSLMGGHAKVGREYAGKVKQLITGSSGLDDAEWGVTLFAHDTFQIKAIVYQMRFDRSERGLRRLRRILHRPATAARRTVPPVAALILLLLLLLVLVNLSASMSTSKRKIKGWVAEWSNAHAWKACLPKGNQGFESLPIRSRLAPDRLLAI